MRQSELRGLTWQNVDLERGIIKVRKRADRFCDMGRPKSRAGTRDIPMAPLVQQTLTTWHETCPKGPLDLVFPNGAGNIEGHANIYHRILKPLLLDCGIVDAEGKPKFGFHALRHAAASLYIEQGWPAKKIQKLLGHASIVMTFDVYGHLFESAEDDLELFEKMESDLLAA